MTDPAIVARGLRHAFGATQALDGVDLTVPRGTVLCLLGPNGAGKTTIVRVLSTQLVPDEGEAHVLDTDVRAEPERVRELVGMAGQFAAVDERLTGRENLVMVGRLAQLRRGVVDRRAAELLADFSLTDAADRPVRGYSGGMRRRLDLAAALVASPPVLYLDEPTTGLDPRARVELWGVIERLVQGGTTMLLTTQYLEEADRLADEIVVIDEGRVVARGTGDELKRTGGQEVLVLGFADAETARRAGDVAGIVEGAAVTLVRTQVEIAAADVAAMLLPVARRLDTADLVPQTVDVRRPTLDDVFLRLTDDDPGADEGDPTPQDARPRAPAHTA